MPSRAARGAGLPGYAVDDHASVYVDGTVVRVLDRGCRDEGRPWRALVQDRTVDNLIHVTLDRGTNLAEGDSLSFHGRSLCCFETIQVDALALDIPQQITMDDEDAQARLSLIGADRTLKVTTSDGDVAVHMPDVANDAIPGSADIIRRPRKGSDPAVNWVVKRFSERGASERRGPIIVLDPALCASGQIANGLPFVNAGGLEYLQRSARDGRAGVKMLLDSPSHPRPRWWGVVVPPSLIQDPLEEWRGFVGRWSGLLPRALLDFDTSLRLSLAHEMAHVVQYAYGIPMVSGSSAAAECFADAAAVLLLILDGGSAQEARLYAHQRSAGALMFPGHYSTGAACHEAISQARRLMSTQRHTTTHEALVLAARIAREYAPPAVELLDKAEAGLPRGGAWHKLGWNGFDDWLAVQTPHVATTFRLAAEGVRACAQAPGDGMRAGQVLARAWDDISERLGKVGMHELRAELQARLDLSCKSMLANANSPDNVRAGLALLGHRVSTAGRDVIRHAHRHVAVGGEPDSMEPLWSMGIAQRLDVIREKKDQAMLGNDDAMTKMGEVAMSLLLDVDTRLAMDACDREEAVTAWAASLPEGRHLLEPTLSCMDNMLTA